MAKNKSPLTELVFPSAGLSRRAAFQMQPPYTTSYAQNVRPFDTVGLGAAVNPAMHGFRQRGGARPGIVKSFAQQLGGVPQLAGYVSATALDRSISNVLLVIAAGTLYTNKTSSTAMAAATNGASFNTTGRQRGCQVGLLYYVADYRPTNVYSQGTGTIGSDGLSLTDAALSGYTMAVGDVIWISPADATQENIFPITGFSGTTISFTNGANALTPQSGATWQINRMPKVYDPASNTVSPLTPTPVPSTEYDQGTVTVSGGTATLAGGDWSGIVAAVGSPPGASYSLTLTIPNTSGIGTQSYLVKTIGGSSLTLTDTTTDADTPAGTTYTLSWIDTYFGVPPLGCSLACNYRGRLFLAGGAWGNIWYASRQLDPNDWDYGYDPADPSRAIAGQDAMTGGPVEPLTALISLSDNYLLMACERSLWIMAGDPAYGGQITPLSHDIGVLGPNAWCTLPDSSVVILSRDGIYMIPAGEQSPPQPISRTNLPAELLDVDWTANVVSLAYDVHDRGVHICVQPNDLSAGTHYWLDWATGSFWPVVFGNPSITPTALLRYAHDASKPATVLLGCGDGYLRSFSPTATDDDGTAFTALVTYGPLRPGGPGYIGQIAQIAADLDSQGQGADWALYGGDTAEAAVAAAIAGSPDWSGSWVPGFNNRDYPLATGAALALVISGGYGWALEGVRVEFRKRGPTR